MVIAAGSVIREPSSGPMMRMVIDEAEGVPPPARATVRSAASAKRQSGDSTPAP